MSARTRHAEWAWESVEQAATLQGGQTKRYATLARRLPSWLMVNGLGQSLAFLYAKGDGTRYGGAEGLLLRQIAQQFFPPDPAKGDSADPMQRVLRMDSATYRLHTRELLNASVWLKRFAEGRFGSEEDAS